MVLYAFKTISNTLHFGIHKIVGRNALESYKKMKKESNFYEMHPNRTYYYQINLYLPRILTEKCIECLNCLKACGLVTFDANSDGDICAAVYGRLMARYYLSFDTMKLFREVSIALMSFNFICSYNVLLLNR